MGQDYPAVLMDGCFGARHREPRSRLPIEPCFLQELGSSAGIGDTEFQGCLTVVSLHSSCCKHFLNLYELKGTRPSSGLSWPVPEPEFQSPTLAGGLGDSYLISQELTGQVLEPLTRTAKGALKPGLHLTGFIAT